MRIDGGCHCGAISYEADLDPELVGICHCTDCQTLSGSVYRTLAVVQEADFKLTGQPKIYVKVGDSGAQREQAFCGECGSPIYATSVGEGPKAYNIRLGTARQRTQLVPKFQVWCRSALDWLPALEAVTSKQKQ